jgi:organic hydroperoxide reductase OsmC/OhrA
MEISAIVTSSASHHQASVRTGTVTQTVAVPARTSGPGSAINGGEFLMPALATCYCNDLYRDAATLDRPIRETDAVAEAHNTVRAGLPVELVRTGA